MIIVSQNAETSLLSELRLCWEKFPNQRCVYLRFSQTALDRQAYLPALRSSLVAIDETDDVHIYLCADNDVFMISRSMTRKRLEQFLAHLAPKLEPVPFEGLASLFEVSVDWWRLKSLCSRKIQALEIENHKALEETLDLDSVNSRIAHPKDLIPLLNTEMLQTISLRRSMRPEPEIMVVEDDLFSRKLVSNVLEKTYRCCFSSDGLGAIALYPSKAPDVLFLDINLPDVSGLDVLELVFKIDPEAYVVMFSGNGDKGNILRSVELGAKGFVGKPFTQDKLLQYIARSPFIRSRHKSMVNA